MSGKPTNDQLRAEADGPAIERLFDGAADPAVPVESMPLAETSPEEHDA